MDKEKEKQYISALEKCVNFINEALPQAGGLCFDIGNLNEALIESRTLGIAGAK